MHELRAHPRVNVRLAVEIHSGARRFTATTRNLSLGGCCVECIYALRDGDAIGIALFVVVDGVEDADTPPLSTRATVQWTAQSDDDSWVAGLRFDELTAAQQQWLARFVDEG